MSATLLGQTLEGRYRIEREIARGGQAIVFSGTDTSSGWRRAIKLLAANFNTPPEVIQRFKQETLLLANLPVHPHIVQVYDGGYDERLRAFYLIMELVEGSTLADLVSVERNGEDHREATIVHAPADSEASYSDFIAEGNGLGVPIPVAVDITRKIANALDHAHQRGVIHRDVKPSNVLLSQGVVKLTDFGIARDVVDTGLTMTGTAIGTLLYMSPEQVQDLEDLDHRSDIYSLGIVLYECLTGAPPFADVKRELIPYYHVREPVRSPREINDAVPPKLEAIVLRALNKAPEERFQSMAEMEKELSQLVEEELVSGDPVVLLDGLLREAVAASEEVVNDEPDEPEFIDSGMRCGSCGTMLPVEAERLLEACPSCHQEIDRKEERPTEVVHDLIKQARRDLGVADGQRVGFDLAQHIYATKLQEPLFEEWRGVMEEHSSALTEGAVVMPPSDLTPDPELLAGAKSLNRVGDHQTNEELQKYLIRLAERHESCALAGHVRGTAHQLAGRYHTINGALAVVAQEATRNYQRARSAFVEGADLFERAMQAWERYESGTRYPRIEQYYNLVKEEVRARMMWARGASLLCKGILDFPHEHEKAYSSFREASALLEPLANQPGVSNDLGVAESYDGYYEEAVAELEEHQEAIAEAQESAYQIIERAFHQDQELVEEDRKITIDWLQRRKAIATHYFRQAENLPQRKRQIRWMVPLFSYLFVFIVWLFNVGQISGTGQSFVDFWSSVPNLLRRSLDYPLTFGSIHQAIVLVVGLDLLLLLPFNLMVKRQLKQGGWAENLLPIVPAPSQFLLPLYDGLKALSEGNANSIFALPFQIAGAILERFAPWLPLLGLAVVASNVSQFGVFFDTFMLWWLFLAIVPQGLGYWLGQKLSDINERLRTVQADERQAMSKLYTEISASRREIDRKRDQLAQEVREQSIHVHKTYDKGMAAITDVLDVLLARMLHYKEAADFVDLPGLRNELQEWRMRVDKQFLGWMGLQHKSVQNLSSKDPTEPLERPTWHPERQPRRIRARAGDDGVEMEIRYPRDGYVLWGTDGLEKGQRQRLQRGAGEVAYATTFTLPSGAKQVNFLFETVGNRWLYEPITVWIEWK